MTAPLSVRSRRAVDEILSHLRTEYGQFSLSTETVVDDPDAFERGRDLFERGMRGGAGVRVVDGGRVLCIREARDPERWVLPAGGHEPGESLAETARRETKEETGVDVELTDVWAAKRRRFVRADDPASRGYLAAVFFEARPVDGDVTPTTEASDEDEEILDADWIDPAAVERDVQALVTDSDAYVP